MYTDYFIAFFRATIRFLQRTSNISSPKFPGFPGILLRKQMCGYILDPTSSILAEQGVPPKKFCSIGMQVDLSV